MPRKKQTAGKVVENAQKSRRKARANSRRKKHDAAFCSPCPSVGHTPQSLSHLQARISEGFPHNETSTIVSNAPKKLTITRAKLDDRRVDWLATEEIHRLILSNENLTEFYKYCQRPNIKHVFLQGNLLSQFILEQKMDKLLTINLSKNRITVFPSVDTLCNVPLLRRLDLSYNKIDCLPEDSLRRLGNLEELLMSFNQLTNLPDAIHVLEKLTTLDIRNNQVVSLPDNLVRLRHLRHDRFLIVGNKIADPPQAVLQEKGLRYFVDYVRAKQSSLLFDGFQHDKDYLKVILVGNHAGK